MFSNNAEVLNKQLQGRLRFIASTSAYQYYNFLRKIGTRYKQFYSESNSHHKQQRTPLRQN
jgi:hypothetical protein